MYTYLIGWSNLNKWYYGARIANILPPEQDLWKVYFTSSKYVKQFREQNGEPDVIEIRKTFTDKNSTILYEQKILQKLKITKKDQWLNKHIGGPKFILSCKGRKLSKEQKQIISERQLGEKNHRFGKPVSHAQREKISKSLTGIKRTPEQIQNLKNNHRSKHGFSGPMLGKKHSKETIKKLSEIHTGMTHTAETKKKISDHRLNNYRPTIHSAETKKKMSDIRKEYHKKRKLMHA